MGELGKKGEHYAGPADDGRIFPVATGHEECYKSKEGDQHEIPDHYTYIHPVPKKGFSRQGGIVLIVPAWFFICTGFLAITRRVNVVASRNNIPMFCPECKTMMISSGGQLKCRKCGYIRKIEADDKMKTKRLRKEKEIMIVDDEEDKIKTMPTIQIKCPKCENNLAFWWLRQLRAADESEVRFFRCTECSHTWRQYD
jgi:DNA-directed RNA polymerase subunit M